MSGETEKPRVSFDAVSRAIRETRFPADADAVVAVLRGGRVPASLIAHHLNLPFHVIRVAFRDEDNEPVARAPRLIGSPPEWQRTAGTLLLVDDVSVSGATFAEAKRHLDADRILTVVLKGRADVVLMPHLPSGCVRWPWNET